MKILITGASGFVGSFLVEHALEQGFEVWAGMRSSSSRQYLQDERIHFLELDLGNEDTLDRQLAAHRAQHGAFDHVIHAAGATKAPSKEAFVRTNTKGTLRLARLLVKHELLTGRFVFVSTLSVLGAPREKARKDADGRTLPGAERYQPLSATDAPQPNTAYGLSKLLAEEGLASIEGLDYVILRPTGVYGPRERDYFIMADSIKKHIDFAVGYTPQIITFIYVRDLVDACFLALTRGKSGSAYLLSDGNDYSSRAFSDLLQREMGVRHVLHITAPVWVLHAICRINSLLISATGKMSPLNMDKFNILRQRNWRCDIAPAREELGYQPQWPLERGVKETIAWYQSEGWL